MNIFLFKLNFIEVRIPFLTSIIMKNRILFSIFFFFNSTLFYAQCAGIFQARYDAANEIMITIANNHRFSIEVIIKNEAQYNNILLAYGEAKDGGDTLFLKDYINEEVLKLVYSEDRTHASVLKGINFLRGAQLVNMYVSVDQNYYDSVNVSKFELPATSDISLPEMGTYYSFDDNFNLRLNDDGSYVYSLGSHIVSDGIWEQHKNELILTDRICNAKFIFRKISEEELVCNTIFGIIKYTSPNLSVKANHFFLKN